MQDLPTFSELLQIAPYATLVLTVAAVGYAAAYWPLHQWIKSLRNRGKRHNDEE